MANVAIPTGLIIETMKVTEKQIISALHRHNGILSKAARSIGINRETIRRRAQANKKIKAALDEARESTKDDAESVIIKAMKSRNEINRISAAKYYLSTQAKDRGYTMKVEKETDVNIPLVINYEVVETEKNKSK